MKKPLDLGANYCIYMLGSVKPFHKVYSYKNDRLVSCICAEEKYKFKY